jgi:hypothetical protein
MRSLGIVLAIIGLAMLLVRGFTYVTERNVAKVGPVEINKTERHPVEWSPIAGAVLLAGGLAVVAMSKKS